MSWTPCELCGWALTAGLGSECTNPECEAGRPQAIVRDPSLPSQESKQAVLDAARAAEVQTYNRKARRGNAVGRHTKHPIAMRPPLYTEDKRPREERLKAEREARALAERRQSKARAARRAQTKARKVGR